MISCIDYTTINDDDDDSGIFFSFFCPKNRFLFIRPPYPIKGESISNTYLEIVRYVYQF
mgnify:FL=1